MRVGVKVRGRDRLRLRVRDLSSIGRNGLYRTRMDLDGP